MKIFILSLALSLFSLETMALSCDITNYKDYIGNIELTKKLIKETKVGCILTKANLKGADLQGAFLWRADFWKTDLTGAHLEGANLKGVRLWGANLQGAYLQGADLKGAKLRGTNFKNAIYNDNTKFPASLGSLFLFARKHNMIKK